ncbi:hypothetical protein QMZ62_23630 [Serratia sp. PF2-63]|uniref:hypothetical protein n=1 Tax=Enterobacterales TaxID=91347 RepID=UPI0024B606A6|nr:MULTISPECIES: hypothetical protein [Enterobacterales]MDI9223694.1 hypothetical protein [Pantoea sp. EA-12]MDI9265944.1 hypothetical protein [Serratia sp. PF2-63]MDI9267089.1 hypothetical protein [Serratia sp. PF-27]
MNRSFLGRAALTLALITGVAGSALSSDAGGDFGAAYEQVLGRYEITALIYKPTHPDAMSTIISDMHLTPRGDGEGGSAQYVLDATGKADVMNVLQKYGEVRQQLRARGPLGEDDRAGAFSASPGKQFSASLKVRFIPSIRQLPPALIVDYSIKAGLERPLLGGGVADERGLLRYASGGSVLLPDKGALMTVNETTNGFLIWIISAN